MDLVTVRYNYRLRVKRQAVRGLMREYYKALWLWNECVSRGKTGEWLTDKELTMLRARHDWLREGSVVVQQQVLRKYRQKSGGRKKYKSRKTELPSFQYTKRGFSIKHRNQLCLANGIKVRMVMGRELPSEPSSVTVYQDSLGHWYASFVVQVAVDEYVEPTNGEGSSVGLDPGVKQIMTATDRAYDLAHPEYGKHSAQELAKAQRKMARRQPKPGQKSSKGYQQAKMEAARIHKKIARQRQDTARKWARRTVLDHEQIALEDFKPKFLSQTKMARKAADAALGATKKEILYYTGKFNRELALIPPAFTTMTCSGCAARTKHRLALSQRVYSCEKCGLIMDRDQNAAFNMLYQAGFNLAGADEIRPGKDPAASATLVAVTALARHSEPGIP